MGLYATTTSFSELIPQLFISNTTTSDSEGEAIVSRHITRAEGIVNSYIGARYGLPFTSTAIPPMLRTLSEDIASWFTVRGVYTQDSQLRQEYLDEYKVALDMLKEIRDGDTGLSLTDGSEVPPNSTSRILSSTQGIVHTFNLDEPKNWEIDPDYLDDVSRDRGV